MSPPAPPSPEEARRASVRERYSEIAKAEGCCSTSEPGAASSCCGGSGEEGSCGASGYSAEELAGLPPGAELGLGCGNPTAWAGVRPGQTVLDLGSGAGVDCLIASTKVGPAGHVIGVDMTPEMVAKARANAVDPRYANVEFRLGEIEHLPVADRSVDLVISNCVVNLASDKAQVYREAYRVLRPGGRLAIADVVATAPIPPEIRADLARWSACSSGAIVVEEVRSALAAAGFVDISIDLRLGDAGASGLEGQASLGVVPADLRATRPVGS